MEIINIDKRTVSASRRNGRVNTDSISGSKSSSDGANSSSKLDKSTYLNNIYANYNAKEFGARGDGVTDDTLALQACIDACNNAGGGIVSIPAGEYKISKGLKGYSNMTFIGAGREVTKISTVNYGTGGASFGDGSLNSTVMLSFVDADNVKISDLWLRGVGIDGSSSQGIKFDLATGNNTGHVILTNLLITDMCSNSALTINTPILTTITNVKVLRVAGNGFYFYDGTSVTLNECYAITTTETGFKFDTMTYCTLNSCACEVCGIAFDFISSTAIVCNGCGTEGILNRNDANAKYKYGEVGYGHFKPAHNGYAYRSTNSKVQLNSCYTRDPGTGHTLGEFDKINCREFTLYPTGVNVDYNPLIRQTYVQQSTLAAGITANSTSFTLAAGTGSLFPASDFYVLVYDSTYQSAFAAFEVLGSYGGAMEMIYVSTRSGDVCTCPNRGERTFFNRTEKRDFNEAGHVYNVDFANLFHYAVTFFDKDGNETGLSDYPWWGYFPLAQMTVKDIPVSGDPLVIGRNIYRNSARLGTEEFQRIYTINDNTTTTWIDTIPDNGTITVPAAPEPTKHLFSTSVSSSSIYVSNNRFIVGDVIKADYSDYLPYPFSRATRYRYIVRSSSGNYITVSKEEDTTNAIVIFGVTTSAEMYLYKYNMAGRDLGIENNFVTTFKNTTTFANGLKSNTVYFGDEQNSVALAANTGVTGKYSQTLQNKSGTVALLSDISASGGGSGTLTEIATSGAITGGIITTTGTIGHSTEDGFLHVPATSTTNDRKVLTAGATAGSMAWESLPAIPTSTDITKWNDTATALNVSEHLNRFIPVFDGVKFIKSSIYDTGNILIGSTVDDGGKLQVTGKIKTTGGLQSSGLIYTSHYNQGIASFRGNWAGSNYWAIGTKNGVTDTISIESTDINGAWVGGNVNLAVTGDLKAKNYNLTSSFTDNLSFNGTYEFTTVGESVVFGDVLYLKFSDGKWWKAKADSFATTPVQRIAVETIAANATGKLLIEGFLRNDSWTFSNANIYLSAATAGLITTTAPVTTGNQIQKIGVAFSATKLHFKPSIDIGEI